MNSIKMNEYSEHNTRRRDLGLYIHIPFCIKKCDYCDFLSAPAEEDTIRRYFDSLFTEIRSYKGRNSSYVVPTIYIGGGTPSCVEPGYITELMDIIYDTFQIDGERLEATIEVNPGTVTKGKLEAYKIAGINRLSFGLQSADNTELKLLGRIHSYEQFKANYGLAIEVGFHNINVDLMSALPGQTINSWETTLNEVVRLQPEHISAYSLILEEGTPFFNRYGEGSPQKEALPDEEADRAIYYKTKEILKTNNYSRYEISNYAKEGYESRHNISYWIGTEYLGMGLGASSLLNDARFHNTHELEQYINACKSYLSDKQAYINNDNANNSDKFMIDSIGIRQEVELLTIQQRMEEFMFLGLRMCRGISRAAFFHRFNKSLEAIYGEVIQPLIYNKLLVSEGDALYLTDYGIDVSNIVLACFLFD